MTSTLATILSAVYLFAGIGLHYVQYVPGHEWLAFYPCDLAALAFLVLSLVHMVIAIASRR